MEAILETKNLTHIYSVDTPFQRIALDSVDFVAYPGEYLGIIGHTGSGKSTLMQHLNGLLKASSGEVLFQGKNIFSDTKYTRETRFQVGLVFQYPEYQLFEETVFQDIAFGPKNMGLESEEIRHRVMESAKFVGLGEDLMEKSPFELSGGQKRRVAIAGVIAMEPRVLILDEPTAGLDPRGAEGIFENIKAYQEAHHATVILVSHSMDDVAKIAQRLVVMEGGKVALADTTTKVFAKDARLREIGLDVPQMTRVFKRLQGMGLDVSGEVFSVEQAKKEILAKLGRGI